MNDYRKDFADFGETTFLDCATQGPFPLRTAQRVREAIELKCHPYRLESQEYFDLPQRVRTLLARLVGAEPEEISLTNSSTYGLSVVANGLDLGPGDEVVVTAVNFPANLLTWLHLRNRGVEVRVLNPERGFPTPEEVTAALTPRTRVVALDYVSFRNGCKIDLEAIRKQMRETKALLVVDATQAIGALPLSVDSFPADAFSCAGYKWLLGPYGVGFAFFRRSIQDRLSTKVLNWMSVEGASKFHRLPGENFTPARDASRFDVPETASFLNLYALEASLEFLHQVGVETIMRHCFGLLEGLREALVSQGFQLNASAEPAQRSTILTFRAPSGGDTERLYQKLRDQLVIVSLREGWIRVSPHLYNSEDDMDRLMDAL